MQAESSATKVDMAVKAAQDGRTDEGERLLRDVLTEEPNNFAALVNLGGLLVTQGNAHGAEPLLRRAINIEPDDPSALLKLATALSLQNRKRRAYEMVCRLLKIVPDNPEALFLASVLTRERGQLEDSRKYMGAYLKREPDNPTALMDYGSLSANLGYLDEALETFRHLASFQPDVAGVWGNIGTVHLIRRRYTDALVSYEKALAFDPDHSEANKNRIICLRRLGYVEEAVEIGEPLIAAHPEDTQLRSVLGSAFRECGRYQDARRHYEEAFATAPGFASAKANLGMLDLLEDKWEQGWPRYEARWKDPSFGMPVRRFNQPKWDGSDLDGRTLFIFAEQGLGDTIQFARYIKLIAETKNAKIVVECQAELAPVLERMDSVSQVAVRGETLPPFDTYIPIMSIPLVLGQTIGTVPRDTPYLVPDTCPSAFKSWLGQVKEKTVGVVWHGNPDQTDNWKRFVPYATFAPIFETPGISFVSFQIDREADETLPEGSFDAVPLLTDFGATASILDKIDLLISIDTATAHMAGALGKPCWTMIPFVPDWRWRLETEESIWYPSMKLYRQTALHDWTPVVQRIRSDLEAL